ncbi:hypothetical protein LOCC1_G001973 [Lachnellula occidentalis]|uniref:C2H2-type domain-containing protein n=1 Tax=Lachnellula occidentalis TaxID=215460 RepID=A0A8H8UK59_9HELO|nr:hypothetical protein LOCC1_G001973 [Lachnellula occidentalis]
MDSNGFYSFDENALRQQAFTDLCALDENFGFGSLPDGPLDPMFGLGGFQASQGAIQQQPASDVFALDGDRGFESLPDGPLDPINAGDVLDFDTANTFNQPLRSMDGAFPALDNFSANNYESFNQTAFQQTNVNDFWSPDNNDFGFGAPYSSDQATLPQGSLTDTSAFNATANADAFNASDLMDPNALNTTAFGPGLHLDALFVLDESETYCRDPSSFMTPNMHYDAPRSTIQIGMPVPPLFGCDWPAAVHIQDVLNNTSGSCTWPGCLKPKLDTSKKLETHVTNIHIEPLRCTVTGCKHTKPFGREGDLERHIASVHKHGGTWKCPHHGCKRHTRGFPRKDKLNEHSRATGHGASRCPYHHCRQRYHLTEAELPSHINERHGNYECAVGTCAGWVSAFSFYDLEYHLRETHLRHAKVILSAAFPEEMMHKFVQQSGGDKDTFTFTESHLGTISYKSGGCKECEKMPQLTSE